MRTHAHKPQSRSSHGAKSVMYRELDPTLRGAINTQLLSKLIEVVDALAYEPESRHLANIMNTRFKREASRFYNDTPVVCIYDSSKPKNKKISLVANTQCDCYIAAYL